MWFWHNQNLLLNDHYNSLLGPICQYVQKRTTDSPVGCTFLLQKWMQSSYHTAPNIPRMAWTVYYSLRGKEILNNLSPQRHKQWTYWYKSFWQEDYSVYQFFLNYFKTVLKQALNVKMKSMKSTKGMKRKFSLWKCIIKYHLHDFRLLLQSWCKQRSSKDNLFAYTIH